MKSSLNWITSCRGYSLRISIESWQQINRECGRSGAVETGGILVGYYTSDQLMAIVTEALPPPKDSTQGPTRFQRGIAGLRGLLTKRWKNERRTYYIGEWHYHPASIVEPSEEDLSQMYAINNDPRYSCREPVMIIVGKGLEYGKRPVRAFVFPQGVTVKEFESI